MGAIKHIVSVDSFDEKILEVFKEVVGIDNRYLIEDFTDFYKLKAELEGDILHVFMFFTHLKKWLKIAEHNLETGSTQKIIPDQELKSLLVKENEELLRYARKEIDRTITIILSLLALISGSITAYVVFQLLKDF